MSVEAKDCLAGEGMFGLRPKRCAGVRWGKGKEGKGWIEAGCLEARGHMVGHGSERKPARLVWRSEEQISCDV